MTVFVDNPKHRHGRMKMCHMIADTADELLSMADLIGVRRKWLQNPGTHREHFDVCLTMRARAVQHGAVEVSTMKIGRLIRARKTDK